MGETARHVVVVGAGIAGATAALSLLRLGQRVTILDPGPPGGEQAASYGNGGWLNPASVIPPSAPGLWRKVPGFLADPLGPLAIRWAYLPRVAGWLARFLRSGSSEARVARTAAALKPLLADSPRLHAAFAAEAGVPELIQRRGLLYIYPDRAAFESEAMAWRIRRALGLSWLELDAEELRQREPGLAPRYRFATLIEDGGHCTDPGAYVAALVAAAVAGGAVHRPVAATGLRIEDGRLRAVLTAQGEITADRAVIAAGARSRPLALAAGDRLPLESERGYHAMILAPEVAPRTPIMSYDGKLVINAMRGGLRVAGQVELAGLDAAPDWRRAAILRDHLLAAFPDLPRDLPAERVRLWMGHRPSMPDGLPCIGRARGSRDVIHGFGHGHVGLAAGARTGRLLAQLAADQPPEIPVEAFDPARFR